MAKRIIYIIFFIFGMSYGSNLQWGYRFVDEYEFFRGRILDIQQDSTGFLWIVNQNSGLYRFDGENHHNYGYIKNALNLSISPDNTILVLCKHGIYKYQAEKDFFTKIISSEHHYKFLKFSGKNTIIYGHQDSLITCDTDGKNKNLLHKGLIINDIAMINSTKSILVSQNGLFLFDLDSKDTLRLIDNLYIYEVKPDDINPNLFWYSFRNHKFQCTDGRIKKIYGLAKYDLKKSENTIVFYDSTNNLIKDLYDINENAMYLGSQQGLFVFDKKNNALEKVTIFDNWNPNVLDILIDRSGVTWIATNDGLVKQYPIQKISHYDIDKFSPDNNWLRCVCANDTGNIWVLGNQNKLFFINNEKQKINTVSWINKYPVHENKLLDIILDDSQGNLYLADYRNVYVCRFDWNSSPDSGLKQVHQFSYPKPFFIKKDGLNRIWMSNLHSLLRIDNKAVIDTFYFDNISGLDWIDDSLAYASITSFGKTKFIKINFNNKSITDTLFLKDNDGNSFITIFNNLVYDSDNQNIYAGSKNKGLYVYDIANQTGSFFDHSNGLFSNSVAGLVKDGQNRIWINTSNALFFHNGDNLKILDENSGLECFKKDKNHTNISRDLSIKTLLDYAQEKLVVGGINGVSVLDPNIFFSYSLRSPFVLTKVKIYNNEVNKKEVVRNEKRYFFSYNDNIITFEFAALNFQKLYSNKYAFLLENFHKNWVYCEDNTITLHNLDPGEYTLKTRYADYTGQWFDGDDYIIIVTPPFWQTFTFYLLLGLVSVFLVLALIKIQTIRIKNQNTVLEYRVLQKTKELHEKTEELKTVNQQLEDIVEVRTKKLSIANKQLIEEIEKKERLNLELQNSRDIIEVNLRQQMLLSQITIDFLSLDNFEEKIDNALKLLGEELDLSSVYLLNHFHDSDENIKVNQWVADPSFKTFSLIQIDAELKSLKSNEVLRLDDLNGLDTERTQLLNAFGIKAILFVPLIVNEKSHGYLGCDVRRDGYKWNEFNIGFIPNIAHVLGNALDRKINQDELLESEETSRALLNAGDSYAVLFDKNKQIIMANKNFLNLIGKKLNEIVGSTIYDHFPKEYVMIREQRFYECMERKESVQFEDQIGHSVFNNIMNPIADRDGEITRVAFFSYNITKLREAEKILVSHQEELQQQVEERTKELRFINSELLREIKQREKAEKELKESERIKRENLKKLALQLAHEIKNPLSSIKSSAQLVQTIQTLKPDVESTLKHMEKINRNVDTCHRIINELYEFTHDADFRLAATDVKSLFGELLEYTEIIGSEKSLECSSENQATDYEIKVDRFRILQALKNIVSNSVDAMMEKGQLNIKFSIFNNDLLMTISDNGVGMDENTLSKIFEPFFTSKTTGFGLGLPIVKNIIERHQGRIEVASKPGVGTTTTVYLPGVTKQC
ncbi:MAG: PAS domain-containing protein [Candidatus Marinimicrobia bacterium]|nr:PAS domain-containing protein [Candidatus Neomarinimicrobiota bacterium]